MKSIPRSVNPITNKDRLVYMHKTKKISKYLHPLLPLQNMNGVHGKENTNTVMNLVITGRHSNIVSIGTE